MRTDAPAAPGTARPRTPRPPARLRAVSRRAVPAAAIALAAAMLSVGCALVPMGGSPTVGVEKGTGDPLSQPYYRVIAAPPKKGGQPLEILKGFEAAMASVDDVRHTVARQYLTGDALRTWNPWAGVTVYDPGKSVKSPVLSEDEDTAQLIQPGVIVATIDDEGRYLPATGTTEGRPFTLVKTHGEWRISSAPPGLLLSVDDVRRMYRTFDLYYPDPTMTRLVVDSVRIPVSPRESSAESLVERLLKGPTSALRGAVRNAFPEGTRLNRITVADQGTLVVDFTSEILAAGASKRRLSTMKAQLSYTLGGLASGRSVEVQVNGEPWPPSGLTIAPGAASDYDPDVLPGQPEAYFIKDGRPRGLTGTDQTPEPLGPAPPKGHLLSHPAISGDPVPQVAALSDDGIVVAPVDGHGQWTRWIRGTTLTAPSWDRYGELWSVERVGPRKSRVWHSNGAEPVQMHAPDLEKADVTAFKVARDGVRVAVALDDGDGPQVRVGAINRDNDTIGGWQTLDATADGAEVVDIAWQDARTLLVLTKDNKQNRELTAWNVTDGTQQTTNVPKSDARIRTIAAAPDGRLLAGADEDGEILAWEPDKKKEWQTLIGGGAVTPAYPLG